MHLGDFIRSGSLYTRREGEEKIEKGAAVAEQLLGVRLNVGGVFLTAGGDGSAHEQEVELRGEGSNHIDSVHVERRTIVETMFLLDPREVTALGSYGDDGGLRKTHRHRHRRASSNAPLPAQIVV